MTNDQGGREGERRAGGQGRGRGRDLNRRAQEPLTARVSRPDSSMGRRSRCMMGRGDAGGDKTDDTSSRSLTGGVVSTLTTRSRSSAGRAARPVNGKLRGPTGVGRMSKYNRKVVVCQTRGAGGDKVTR